MKKLIVVSMVFLCCVLEGAASAGSLTDNGNGTVTDSRAFLMWQQGESSALAWDTALTTCETSTLAGYTDWRLPNHKELLSLVDDTRYNPSINITMFPGAFSTGYWTSTTYTIDSIFAWAVYFDSGDSNDRFKADTYFVRCVRGGQ